MHQISVTSTQKKQVIDLTDRINEILGKGKLKNGLCHLLASHTTVALTVADLDTDTDLDYLDAFEEMIPKLKYRHPHDPSHVPDHILSALIGVTLTLPVKDGKLLLGTWQRLILIEFDGPQDRNIIITMQYL